MRVVPGAGGLTHRRISGPGPCSTGRRTSPGLLEEALVRRTPRESTAGKQGRRMLAHKRGQIEARKGVGRAGRGAALPRTGVGGRVGTADRGPPRASAKLPEAASGMGKQEGREWRGPAAGFHPQGCPRSREPFPGSVSAKAALGRRSSRPSPPGPGRSPAWAGRRTLQIRASWSRGLHGAPAASGLPPSPAGPPAPGITETTLVIPTPGPRP